MVWECEPSLEIRVTERTEIIMSTTPRGICANNSLVRKLMIAPLPPRRKRYASRNRLHLSPAQTGPTAPRVDATTAWSFYRSQCDRRGGYARTQAALEPDPLR